MSVRTFPPEPQNFYGTRIKAIGVGVYGKIYVTEKGYIQKVVSSKDGGMIPEVVNTLILDHPSIIKYVNVYNTPEASVLIMNWYPGDLRTLIDAGIIVGNTPLFLSIAYQLINALAYLDSHNIIHRDIKPENILYRSDTSWDYKVVLTDFGLSLGKASYLNPDISLAYTICYRAPEVLTSNRYTSSADVWALGCTLYELYTGEMLFSVPDESPDDMTDIMFQNIYQTLGPPDVHSYVYNDFMDRLVSTGSSTATSSSSSSNNFEKFDISVLRILMGMLNPSPELRKSIYDFQYFEVFREHTSILPPVINLTSFKMLGNFFRAIDYSPLGSMKSITPQSIKIVVQWLFNLSFRYDFSDVYLHTTFQTFLRYLCLKPEYPVSNIHMCLLSCMGIVSSFLGEPLTFSDLVIIGQKTFKEEEILETQYDILSALNYDLHLTTPLEEILVLKEDFPKEVIKLAIRLLNASLYLIGSRIEGIVMYSSEMAFLCLDTARVYYDSSYKSDYMLEIKYFIEGLKIHHSSPTVTLYPLIKYDVWTSLLQNLVYKFSIMDEME